MYKSAIGTLQVTDYAIARRIVDLHSRNEESVDRVYSVEDVTRYLMFARQFKPKVQMNYQMVDVKSKCFQVIFQIVNCFMCFLQISADAQEYMIEEYKRLRQRDGSGAHKSAWRITVRQLESMIRLSEAMARLYCVDEVKIPQQEISCFVLDNH